MKSEKEIKEMIKDYKNKLEFCKEVKDNCPMTAPRRILILKNNIKLLEEILS